MENLLARWTRASALLVASGRDDQSLFDSYLLAHGTLQVVTSLRTYDVTPVVVYQSKSLISNCFSLVPSERWDLINRVNVAVVLTNWVKETRR